MAAAFVQKILFAVIAFWSLLTWAVAAGAVAKGVGAYGGTYYTYDYWKRYYYHWTPAAAGATVAFGVLTFLYFTAAVVLIFIGRALPVVADFVVIFCLFVFGLGAVGSLSTWAVVFRNYDGGAVGQAALAIGWILVLLLLATLIFELVVVIRGHGFNGPTLRSSLQELDGELGSTKATRNATTAPVTV